ncbi:MAG: V-type ATP synthase subunit K [Spirochaetaceae bacterium]|nr:V-type ATP synthase subunit K [Spirochaetaceae bacterium]HOX49024.1 V-type ATP synthase subunit K [Spirochaetales bacterium]HRY71998.1 V-type ATP synthase subunit K [Spirochaetia bacterium]
MNIGMIGVAAVLGLSAIGSAIGAGIAGQAAIGAWKRNYMANKPASFLLVVFAGAPLTQTIYGFILLQRMLASTKDPLLLLGAGIIGGAAMGMSAIAQGKASASSCDAFGETGKGFGQYITVVGLCETVALFVMAFTFGAI